MLKKYRSGSAQSAYVAQKTHPLLSVSARDAYVCLVLEALITNTLKLVPLIAKPQLPKCQHVASNTLTLN